MSQEGSSTAQSLWKRVNWSKEEEPDSEREPLIPGRSSTTVYDTSDVQIEIDQTTEAANATLGKLLHRGENIEEIKGKSENLKNVSSLFQRRAKTTEWKAWWNGITEHLWTILFCLFLVLLGVCKNG
jgi:Leucine-rich repeat (LRR) protein